MYCLRPNKNVGVAVRGVSGGLGGTLQIGPKKHTLDGEGRLGPKKHTLDGEGRLVKPRAVPENGAGTAGQATGRTRNTLSMCTVGQAKGETVPGFSSDALYPDTSLTQHPGH